MNPRSFTLLVAALGAPALHAASMIPVQQLQTFSADPAWEGVNNRAVPVPCTRTVTQDFRYRASSSNAGGAAGEMGGRIQRAPTPSYYAKAIATKTLNEPLSASGKFCVTQSSGGSGMLFGWFSSTNNGGWRTANSLAFRLDGEGGVFRVLFEYCTGTWHAGGTPPLVIGGATLLPANGTSHTWNLSYDPNGNGGHGRITFVVDGQTFTVDLAAGDKAEGATFDRFGMFNQQTDGSYLTAYFDDLVIDGVVETFSANPGWSALRNNGTFSDCEVGEWHNFGYSPTTNSGGAAGEIGGLAWRTEPSNPADGAYYGAVIPAMDLNTELRAAGRVALTRAGSDSAMLLGWFNSATARLGEGPPRNFIGVIIEGPSRVGFYFRGAYNNGTGVKRIGEIGPSIKPDRTFHDWTFYYSPTDNGNLGRITVTFDGQSATVDLEAGVKSGGATFNRFGLVNYQAGGSFNEVWFDNLSYTVLELDSDDDGAPDSWETANGFNPANADDANADADGDGSNNLQEFRAATQPRDSSSGLRIKNLERIGGNLRVTFPSVLGRHYALESSDALVGPVWSLVQTNIPGTGGDMILVTSTTSGPTARFYRVRVLF